MTDIFNNKVTRRTALTTITTGIAGAFAGCTNGDSGGSASTDTPTDASTPTETPTDTETPQPSLQDQLDAVREATSQYEDPQVALQDGFKAGGPYVPGMGWHFQHPERLQAAAQNGFDLERPPILTYLDTEDGLMLGSVEYGVPTNAIDDTPELFNDETADATEEWHTHGAATHVFANGDGEQTPPAEITFAELTRKDNWTEFSPPDEDLEPGDTVELNWGTAHGKEGDQTERVADIVNTHPGLTTLHVWVHAENHEGVFNPVNPEYMEGDGDHSH